MIQGVASAAVLLSSAFAFSPVGDPSYYGIFIKGDLSGWESVVEIQDSDGNRSLESEHEIFVADGMGEIMRLSFQTTLTLNKNSLVPVRYACRYTSGQSRDHYEVYVEEGRLKRQLTRAGHGSEATIPAHPDLILVDFNVYHHYSFMVRKYDLKKGGRQILRVYIPIIGGEISAAMTRVEDSNLRHARGVLPVHNFRVEFSGVWTGVLAADRQGRMVRLVLREQDLEVLHQDLLPEGIDPPTRKPTVASPPPRH